MSTIRTARLDPNRHPQTALIAINLLIVAVNIVTIARLAKTRDFSGIVTFVASIGHLIDVLLGKILGFIFGVEGLS